jgi:hypothetical protein
MERSMAGRIQSIKFLE